MTSTINIRIKGKYGSISELEWLDVPQFAVIMGVNGAGKSQLLEVIAARYGA
jgi:AAA15 family ATPase/GTPase